MDGALLSNCFTRWLQADILYLLSRLCIINRMKILPFKLFNLMKIPQIFSFFGVLTEIICLQYLIVYAHLSSPPPTKTNIQCQNIEVFSFFQFFPPSVSVIQKWLLKRSYVNITTVDAIANLFVLRLRVVSKEQFWPTCRC